NHHTIAYVNPLNHINEDIAVQAVLGTAKLCPTDEMFYLVSQKYGAESLSTTESTWATISAQLPGVRGLSIEDLAAVRANEDAFNTWRTSLRDAIHRWEV